MSAVIFEANAVRIVRARDDIAVVVAALDRCLLLDKMPTPDCLRAWLVALDRADGRLDRVRDDLDVLVDDAEAREVQP